jgi:hypothetical protein
LSDALFDDVLVRVKEYEERINHDVFMPTVKWAHESGRDDDSDLVMVEGSAA